MRKEEHISKVIVFPIAQWNLAVSSFLHLQPLGNLLPVAKSALDIIG